MAVWTMVAAGATCVVIAAQILPPPGLRGTGAKVAAIVHIGNTRPPDCGVAGGESLGEWGVRADEGWSLLARWPMILGC